MPGWVGLLAAFVVFVMAVSALVAVRLMRRRQLRERQERLLALEDAEALSRLDPDGPEAAALRKSLESRIEGWARVNGL